MLSHAIFFGLFYSVLITIGVTLTISFFRAVQDFRTRRAGAVCWQATFPDLPARERACRHEFTGEFAHRTCERAFDCRGCLQHSALVAKSRPQAAPDSRFYHRGHTWVQAEPDGLVTIGLDPLAESLVAHPDRVDLPPAGTPIHVNGVAWHVEKRGARVRILAPVDGEVAATGGPGKGWYLKVRPAGRKLDTRHLLRGAEVQPWMSREIARLHTAMAHGGEVPTMADGGMPAADIAEAVPERIWESLCGEVFLQL